MTERVDFERTDVPPSLIVKLATGVGAFVLAVPLVMPVVYPLTRQSRSPHVPKIASGAAVLEVDPRARLAEFEKMDSATRDRYGWIDRDHNIVQIPVARAMELLARRGLSGWPATSSTTDETQDGSRH